MVQKLAGQKHRTPRHISRQLEEYRTPLTDACKHVLESLVETRKPHSIGSLARESKLHRRTVEKCVDLLMNLQQNWLEDYRLKLYYVDNKRIVETERKTGLLSLPEEMQNLFIKLKHFPYPSAESCQLLNLYLQNATDTQKSVSVENALIEKLVKQGHIKKSAHGIFLSQSGITIAKGILKIYPELKFQGSNVPSF